MTKFKFAIDEFDDDYRAYVTTHYMHFSSWGEAEEWKQEYSQRPQTFIVRWAMVGKYVCESEYIFNQKKEDLFGKEG